MAVRRLILLSVCLMISQTALSSVRPMTSYRLIALGDSHSAVGWISALTAVAPLVLALPVGRFAAKGLSAWVGVIGSLTFTVGCAGLALGTSFRELAVASVVLGAGNICQMISFQNLIASETPEVDYDRNYGWYSAGASLGQLIGPLAGTMAFDVVGGGLAGTTAANLISAAGGAVGLLLSLFLLIGAAAHNAASSSTFAGPPASARRTLRYPGAVASIYVSIVILSAIDLISVYLPVLGHERGWSASFVGLLLVVRAAFSVVARLFIGFLANRTSRRSILISTGLATAVLVSIVPSVNPTSGLLIVMAVLGLGMGVGQPVGMAWTVAIVPPDARSTAISVRLMGNRLGQVIVPVASSAFVMVAGAGSVFWLLGALLVSSAGAVAASK